jgi:RNA polymerase sigma-70 factor (ECF subfamily)
MPRPDESRFRAALASADEATVIELARSDDPAAFEELVRRRQGQVRQLLRRLCGDAHLADDLAQETFVRAWRGLPSLQANAAFWGWLRRIAARTWAKHLQRQHPHGPFAHHQPLGEHGTGHADDDGGDGIAADAAGTGGPTPEERLDLDTALARLAPAARACMILAYQAGMSHSEIAEALALPLGTVKTHITRSTRALRQWLGDTRE